MNKILILDAGGVIIDDLGTQFWDMLVSHCSNKEVLLTEIYAHYKKDVSAQLWTGKMDEHDFLHLLKQYDIELSVEQLNEMVAHCLIPLPAYEMVTKWADQIDIYIMSNHRTAWLLPALESLQPYLKEIYISDTARMKKPNLDWFKFISEKHPQCKIVFVDNTLHNIEAAKLSGWQTIFADKEHKWIEEVNELVQGI